MCIKAYVLYAAKIIPFFVKCKKNGCFLLSFHHMCTKSERTFHVSGVFDDVGLG